MSTLKLAVLRNEVEYLRQNLGDPCRYLRAIREEGYLTDAECEEIKLCTGSKRIEKFVEILCSKQCDKAFDVFVKELRNQRVHASTALHLRRKAGWLCYHCTSPNQLQSEECENCDLPKTCTDLMNKAISGGSVQHQMYMCSRCGRNVRKVTNKRSPLDEFQICYKCLKHENPELADQTRKCYLSQCTGEPLLVASKTKPKPVFMKQPPSKIEIYTGEDLILKCEATGNPPLSYQWFNDQRHPLEGKNQPTLTIHKVTQAIEGYYICRAVNDSDDTCCSFSDWINVIVYPPCQHASPLVPRGPPDHCTSQSISSRTSSSASQFQNKQLSKPPLIYSSQLQQLMHQPPSNVAMSSYHERLLSQPSPQVEQAHMQSQPTLQSVSSEPKVSPSPFVQEQVHPYEQTLPTPSSRLPQSIEQQQLPSQVQQGQPNLPFLLSQAARVESSKIPPYPTPVHSQSPSWVGQEHMQFQPTLQSVTKLSSSASLQKQCQLNRPTLLIPSTSQLPQSMQQQQQLPSQVQQRQPHLPLMLPQTTWVESPEALSHNVATSPYHEPLLSQPPPQVEQAHMQSQPTLQSVSSEAKVSPSPFIQEQVHPYEQTLPTPSSRLPQSIEQQQLPSQVQQGQPNLPFLLSQAARVESPKIPPYPTPVHSQSPSWVGQEHMQFQPTLQSVTKLSSSASLQKQCQLNRPTLLIPSTSQLPQSMQQQQQLPSQVQQRQPHLPLMLPQTTWVESPEALSHNVATSPYHEPLLSQPPPQVGQPHMQSQPTLQSVSSEAKVSPSPFVQEQVHPYEQTLPTPSSRLPQSIEQQQLPSQVQQGQPNLPFLLSQAARVESPKIPPYPTPVHSQSPSWVGQEHMQFQPTLQSVTKLSSSASLQEQCQPMRPTLHIPSTSQLPRSMQQQQQLPSQIQQGQPHLPLVLPQTTWVESPEALSHNVATSPYHEPLLSHPPPQVEQAHMQSQPTLQSSQQPKQPQQKQHQTLSPVQELTSPPSQNKPRPKPWRKKPKPDSTAVTHTPVDDTPTKVPGLHRLHGMDPNELPGTNHQASAYTIDAITLDCHQNPPTQKQKKLLDDALKDGFVLANITNVLCIGAAGTGKTHLKFLLLRKRPLSHRHSTPCAETAIRVLAYSRMAVGQCSQLHEVSLAELRGLLARSAKFGVAMERKSSQEIISSPDSTNSCEPSDLPTGNFQGSCGSTHENVSLGEPTGLAETYKILQLMNGCSLEDNNEFSLNFIHWVNFVDSGGQPQFHEALPAFIRNASLSLVVLKLSERLNEFPETEFHTNDQCYKLGRFSQTNEQIIQCVAQTVQSHQFLTHPERLSLPGYDAAQKQPRFLLVGTFKDEEHKCQESLEKKNERLKIILRPFEDILIPRSTKEIIFPVNGLLAGPDDQDPVAKELREAIIDSKQHITAKIPLRWYFLDLELKALEKKVVTIQECWKIAQKLHFQTQDELIAALEYIHNLNLFMYYPAVLPDIVFCDPQILLNKVSQLIELSFKLNSLNDSRNPAGLTLGAQRRLVEQGTFAPTLLEFFSDGYTPGTFSSSDLLKLLEHLHLAARIKEEDEGSPDEYFMPSLLPLLSTEEISELSQNMLSMEVDSISCAKPLIICFPNGWSPNGLFCAVIVYLLSGENHSLSWKRLSQNTEYYYSQLQPKNGRNCAIFAIEGNHGTVTIINSGRYFEIHTTCSSDLCPVIKHCVFQGIEKVGKQFMYSLKCWVAFFCPCGSQPSPHLAELGADCCLICTKNRKRHVVTPNHTVWTEIQKTEAPAANERSPSPSSVLCKDDKPSLPKLLKFPGKHGNINIPEQIGTNYKTFGTFLLKDDSGMIISSIENAHNATEISGTILQKWIGGKGLEPFTWDTLVNCLRDAELNVLANDIEEVLH